MQLTDRHRLLVRETLQEIEETPPPMEPGQYGPVLFLLGLVSLAGFPFLARGLGLGSGVAMPVLVLAGAAMVIGVVLSLTNGGFTRGAASAAAEAALRELEDGEDDEDVLLRAATLLLSHAYVTHGPATTSAFDTAEARKRIGDRMSLVTAVESYLTAEERLYPVFTLEPEEPGAPG